MRDESNSGILKLDSQETWLISGLGRTRLSPHPARGTAFLLLLGGRALSIAVGGDWQGSFDLPGSYVLLTTYRPLFALGEDPSSSDHPRGCRTPNAPGDTGAVSRDVEAWYFRLERAVGLGLGRIALELQRI